MHHERIAINYQREGSLYGIFADILRGLYKPHEYGKVILPMTVIKRLHDTLLPTRDDVLAVSKSVTNIKVVQIRDRKLTDASGYTFYNTSRFTFENLLSDPENIYDNFNSFLNGFSENVRDILDNFEF